MSVNEKPQVTVVIPCYNRGKYITKTIDSVLDQTYDKIELVVVDDGSTDNSYNILKQYKDKIKLLTHPGRINKGQSAAINLGIKNSKSKYVAILDSDDLFERDKIRLQVEFLEDNPDIGLVYGNGYNIDENGKLLYKIYSETHKEYSNPERVLLDCYFLLPSNSLIKRCIYEKIGGFDETLRSAQDHDMAIRVAEATKIAYLNEVIFFYRNHNDSISKTNANLRWNNGFIILEKAKQRYNYSALVIRKRFALLHFRVGQCFVEKKQYVTAFYHFALAGLLDPIRAFGVILGKEHTGGLH